VNIKMKLYALGGAALLGIPLVRSVTSGLKARKKERVYHDVLKAALADGKRDIDDCIKAAKAAADRIGSAA